MSAQRRKAASLRALATPEQLATIKAREAARKTPHSATGGGSHCDACGLIASAEIHR